MLNGLIVRYKKGRVARQTIARKQKSQFINFESVKSILLILDEGETITELEQQRLFGNRTVKKILVSQSKVNSHESDELTLHYSDFNMSGILCKSSIQKLLACEYDLYIDLSSQKESRMLNYLAANNSCKVRLGCIPRGGHLDILWENSEENTKLSKEQLLKELKEIK